MLLIEKVIKLMDDFHYNEFREHVKNLSVRSYYPLVLVDVIDRDIEVEQDSDKLCEMVYTELDEKTKKKFFQLAHYTFKLTTFISKNYPNYLQHNITKIQQLINQGKIKSADILIAILLDVSDKVENFETQISVLQIIAQKEALAESIKDTVKIHQKIGKIIGYQQDLNDIYLYWRQHFSAKGKALKTQDAESLLAFFVPYYKSKSKVIQLLSQYFYLQGLYYLKNETFYLEDNFKKLLALEKEVNNFEYLVFPFLVDLDYRIAYLKLRHLIQSMDETSIMEASSKLLEISENVLFWKNFVNLPELFSIAVQASYFSNNYMTPYKDNHWKDLPIEVKKQMNVLKEKCKKQIETQKWEERFTIKFINLQTAYAGLLLLGDKAEVKSAVRLLEGLLFNYQQTPFHTFIDPIFTVLVIANFSLKNYDDVESSYRRYKKMTYKKVVNPGNDLVLHGFYYAAKWLETNRKQYIKKLNNVLEQTKSHNFMDTHQLFMNLIEYYQIPI